MTHNPQPQKAAAVVSEKGPTMPQQAAAAVPHDDAARGPQDPAAPLLFALAQSHSNLDAADAAVFVRFADEKIPLVRRISIIEAIRSGRWGAWRNGGGDDDDDTKQDHRWGGGDLEKSEPREPQPARPRTTTTTTRRRLRHERWPVFFMVVCLLLVGAAFVYADLSRCHAKRQFLCSIAWQSRPIRTAGWLPRYQALGSQ